MKQYKILFRDRVIKQIDSLDAQVVKRVWEKIKALADDPRPAGCKKMGGYKDTWRIRIGDYRVIYSIDDAGAIVIVMMAGHRREVYK